MAQKTEDFLAEVAQRHIGAERAFRSGDPGPRIALWSGKNPSSWLGPFGTVVQGTADVAAHFRRVATRMSHLDRLRFDVLIADVMDDTAYLVAREHAVGTVDGSPETTMTCRVSRIFRREAGQWRVAHGHGDLDPFSLELPYRPPQARPEGGNDEH